MPAFIDHVLASGGKALWLDYVDYAGRLLAGGAVPWLDTASCGSWLRKAQGLLHSDVVALPVDRVCGAWLDGHPALRDAMRARTRAVFPIKVLLADEALRAHLVALVQALRGSAPGPDFALGCPSPRAWVAAAYSQAHDANVDVGEDEADSAALYMADFLRSFGESGIQALLLVETAASEPASSAEVACYQSVVNVAGHYRWDVGLGVPGLRFDGEGTGFDFCIGPRPIPGCVCGRTIDPGFWDGAPAIAAPPSGFRYATVPASAEPERVLERLALLR